MNKKIQFITPYQTGLELKYAKKAIKSNWIAPLGPFVNLLEDKIIEYTGAQHCIAVNSGTSAIHLALLQAGLQEGEVVLCSDFTFIGGIEAVKYCGGIPVFIGADIDNMGMDVKQLEKALEDYKGVVRAVIVAHMYGFGANLITIRNLCNKHDVVMIEDSCETLGAEVAGYMTGTIGDYGAYSFNGNKIVTTGGGGALVSKYPLNTALKFATQHRDSTLEYIHNKIGFNYRLSNISAAIGVAQLEEITKRIELKKKIYDTYVDAFKDNERIQIVQVPFGSTSNYWVTVAYLKDISAKEMVLYLATQNIEARMTWKPMHQQPVFKNNSVYGGKSSSELYEKAICLPSDINMTSKQQSRVIKTILKKLGEIKNAGE